MGEKNVMEPAPEQASLEPFDILIKFQDGYDMRIQRVYDFGFPDGNFNVLFVNKGSHNILFNMDVIAYAGRTSDFGIE